MALTIEQFPLYTLNTAGQELIFTVSDAVTVSNFFNVKYVAEVHISTVDINLATTTAIVGTFKTTPNNAGVGMFQFSPVVESFVSPDNLAALGSSYKTIATTAIITHPLHLVDKFSLNDNVLRYLKIRFTVEGSATADGTVSVQDTDDSLQYSLINGYLKHTDKLKLIAGHFGYDNAKFNMGPLEGQFLTNAPLTQYANIDDYGTLSFMATPNPSFPSTTTVDEVAFKYYNSSDGIISAETVENKDANGGYTTWDSDTKKQILHIGCFPANLQNWSSAFATAMGLDLSYYTVRLLDSSNADISETVTININCPTLKGYEPIRLTWLNQWGVWDYYTFKMKSTRTLSTKGSTYEQLAGTWNESIYLPSGYRGGKKAFRVNATEKIKMNTEFVNEAESEWFEELINSPEVYILEGFESTVSTTQLLNQYVVPVRLTTSSYTRKTVANDKLMQYTFEVEKSKTLRTQSV